MRVGMIDSGLAPELCASGAVMLGGLEDKNKHGTMTSRLLAEAVAAENLICAAVFDERGMTTPQAVADGLLRLCSEGAEIILLALGLSNDRDVLRMACQKACEKGVILVASAPARGGPCYPARYLGVISVCGDARCQPGQASWLGGQPALFGASPLPPTGEALSSAGPSMAAARFLAWAYPCLTVASDREQALLGLPAACAYQGREHRQG